VSIFWAADGSLADYICQDAGGYTNQEFFDVAWDNVGNLYTIHGEDGLSQSGWRVYSSTRHARFLPRLGQPVSGLSLFPILSVR